MAISSALSNLAGQMPGQNQRVTQGLQEAARTQMRQQLAGQGPMPVQQIQAIGQQVAAQKGQATLQGQEQASQQAAKVGQLALQQDQQDKQMRLQARQLQRSKQARTYGQMLNNLDSQLKVKLVDEQMSFQKDELGRTLFNERQLMDYKMQTAKSDLELRDFEDKFRQASDRRLMLLKAAQAKLQQEAAQSYTAGQQQMDQQTKERMTRAAWAAKEKIRKEQARQANAASMFSAGGTLLGAVAGGVLAASGPLGWAVGAALGAGVGGGLGSIAFSSPDIRNLKLPKF